MDYEAKNCERNKLTDCQCRYLRLIDDNEPLTSGQFAKLTCVSRPTVTQLLNRFIKDGYIEKECSKSDKRVWYIQITEKGRKIARYEQNARYKIVQLMETNLDDNEINQLIQLMEKLLKIGG